jgi:hypothetical protein
LVSAVSGGPGLLTLTFDEQLEGRDSPDPNGTIVSEQGSTLTIVTWVIQDGDTILSIEYEDPIPEADEVAYVGSVDAIVSLATGIEAAPFAVSIPFL